MTVALLQAYARRIRELRRANPEVPETALAPAFQELLHGIIAAMPLAPGLVVMPEFRNPGVGRPDIALMRQGLPPRAFVELKAPAKSADPTRWRGQDQRQFERFGELPCWATCNFAEIRLFTRREEEATAIIVPDQALRPDRDDARVDKAIAAHDAGPFLRLVERLVLAAGSPPVAVDAEALAQSMAHSARLVKGIVRDRLAELHEQNVQQHALLDVRAYFRDVLYAHPEAAGYARRDFDELFSGAFAQTLAFGLLLVREGTGAPVDQDAWTRMPPEHPLMRATLRVLSQPEVLPDIGVGFDVLCDTVNSFAPDILAPDADGRDPILYFYEAFLKTFDPEARERYGVYYTPVDVVRYMVGALDRALRTQLDTQGLSDPAVTLLDPATGTGTFLLGVAQRVEEQAAAQGGGMAALAMENLAARLYGFELLVGPYAVAHYRLHHALRRAAGGAGHLPRLGVYLADTLAEPGAAAPGGALGFIGRDIEAEHSRADELKTRTQILAIIGNPPYRRLETGENETLVGRWLDELWDDLKEPVRQAGQGNQLNTFPELTVAFWRWAIWKLFEAENAPRRGVVAFITNRKFLTGWPYAGLRQMMRQRFDRIEIFDLRGDVRVGERAGVENDQGVFNIQVGTAITIAIADGSKAEGEAADIFYHDAWAESLYSRRQKLERLRDRAAEGTMPNPVPVRRGWLDDMRPPPFRDGEWVSLEYCFLFRNSGTQTKRDSFVYSVSRDDLLARLREFRAASEAVAVAAFHPTGARPVATARALPIVEENLVLTSYRPFDRRWLYNHSSFLDRPRPDLQAVWGADNAALYAMSFGTGMGPAVWCHGLLPDYHAFSGRGGYAFPLYDRRPGSAGTNLNPALIAGLSAAYGVAVAPEAVFDYLLAFLSARDYALRFAEDLEDTFPHAAFPADHALFAEGAALGAQIRALESFGRPPQAMPADFVRLDTRPSGLVARNEPVGESLTLCADGSGMVSGLPQPVWRYAVSGYRLLPRWLEARTGQPADLAFFNAFRDICGRIAELIDRQAEADRILQDVLRQPLSREALGLDI